MSVACVSSGQAWASVAGNGNNLTKQEWMYSFLITLCETLAAAEGVPVSDCSVAGVWDKVTGDGYVSEQQFWAQSLNTLCAIKDNITSGGGTADGTTNMALGGIAPPTDGSVLTKRVFDTDTGFEWYNSGTIAAPTWNNV